MPFGCAWICKKDPQHAEIGGRYLQLFPRNGDPEGS
jgi:hypothetical protein